MFTVGLPLASELFFMLSTMLIAIPTGVKVFNWSATLYRGSLTFEPPMLWALAFLFMFTIGGLSGLMLAIAPADFQYQDTYFVVAHFHYVLVPGSVFGIIGGVYYWLPKWTGHMYNMTLAKWHFWLSTIFVNVLFFPQHFLGLAGMPRRIPDYATQFADWNMVSSIGGFCFGASQILFPIIIWQCAHGGERATDRVWEGAQRTGVGAALTGAVPQLGRRPRRWRRSSMARRSTRPTAKGRGADCAHEFTPAAAGASYGVAAGAGGTGALHGLHRLRGAAEAAPLAFLTKGKD